MTSPTSDPAAELARQAALLEQLRRDVADLQLQASDGQAAGPADAVSFLFAQATAKTSVTSARRRSFADMLGP